MKKVLLASVFAVGIAVLGVPGAPNIAEACNCISYGQYARHADGNTSDIKDHFSSRLRAMQDALTEIIILSTSQLVTTLKEQVQGDAQIAQTQDQRNVVREIERARYEATMAAQTGSTACEVITSLLVNQSSNSVKKLVQMTASKKLHDWDYGAIYGEQPEGSSPVSEARKYRISRNAEFCDDNMQRLGLCSVQTEEKYKGAPQNISQSLLAKNTLDPNQLSAADLFLINATNPEPLDMILPRDLETVEGEREFTRQLTHRARMSIPQHFLTEALARRTSDNVTLGGMGDDARRKWAEDEAAKLLGYDQPPGQNFPDGVSWLDWMELRSKMWAFNPQWLTEENGRVHSNAILKEIASILAFMAYQNWEQYKLMEEIGVVQASHLSVALEDTRNR